MQDFRRSHVAQSQQSLPPDFPYWWCSDYGEDEYGIFMGFEYEGVRQGFRWIPPGTFMMGSPKDEPGRYADEIQHEVTLTQGFWMGETTVTQRLWQVVMGENPSGFKGEDLPVDSVSWEDAARFMNDLNERQPDLRLCLPTEAQWEYACRAGTTTPFHFGESITTDQVNYDGNAPWEGSPEGEYRGKTMAVKALPTNAWGLYQMHGNVLEWCQDWYRKHTAKAQMDPGNADSGTSVVGQNRVLRGGSWSDVGRVCRSAFRGGYPPGYRGHIFGFRLARVK